MKNYLTKFLKKLNPNQNVVMGLIGLILASFGAMLLMGYTPASITHGQTGRPYTSTWKAQKAITVCCWGSNNVEVGIGISEWLVDGKIEGVPAFTETWKTNDPSAIFVKTNAGHGDRVFVPYPPSSSHFDASKWLLGAVFTERGSSVLYLKEKTIDSLRADWEITKWKSRAGGNGGVACDGDDIDCRYATGAYGWTDSESIGSARNSSQPTGGGIFMPLEWTVNGTLFLE
ncbi:MAG: hypothetical protein NUV80_00160 [Candidatus Berkelbacteria bacterium]|nr:hypothetical protein [Candidatus Berkelbacteria bacterium]MCR4306965.1 hypothetical protein [Candidatus Berkelbacteria bacterium]